MTEDDVRRIVLSMKACLDPSHIWCDLCRPVCLGCGSFMEYQHAYDCPVMRSSNLSPPPKGE
jgi:hypothetical protein